MLKKENALLKRQNEDYMKKLDKPSASRTGLKKGFLLDQNAPLIKETKKGQSQQDQEEEKEKSPFDYDD